MEKMTAPERKVLLVDNEPYVIEMLAEELGARGIRCLSALDGSSAFGMIEKEKPSVIVSDYHMPGLDGIELLRFLRNVGYVAPVIWITGQADEGTKKEAWKLGVYHVYRKPFDPVEVARAVAHAMEMAPEAWLNYRPEFMTDVLMSKHFQRLQLEVEKGLYEKLKERCLKDSVSINRFIGDLIESALK